MVITNGSVQAPEQLYWPQAAALARAGYVVLTWDPQTQGRSDGPGEEPTQNENSTPQSVGAFTDGTQDAIDFFLSTPSAPFRPRNAATNPSVNHAAKQNRRVAEGRNAPFNPLHGMLDRTGWASPGNSLGASGVSKIASEGRARGRGGGLGPAAEKGVRGYSVLPACRAWACPATTASARPTAPSACYPRPRDPPPTPRAPTAPRAPSAGGVPTGQINTKGGTHFEYCGDPQPRLPGHAAGAGPGRVVHDRVVRQVPQARRARGPPAAHQPLAAGRREQGVDPQGDANLYSKDLRSRIDVRRADGSRALCEDLRGGCGILPTTARAVLRVDFGVRPRHPRAVRPARCATGSALPRRLDRSRSGAAAGEAAAEPAHEGHTCGPSAAAARTYAAPAPWRPAVAHAVSAPQAAGPGRAATGSR